MKITTRQLRHVIRRALLESTSLMNEDLSLMMQKFESVGGMLTGSKEDLEQIDMLADGDIDALNQVFEKYITHVMQQLIDQVIQVNPKVEVTISTIKATPNIERFESSTGEMMIRVAGKVIAQMTTGPKGKPAKRDETIRINIDYNRNLDKYNWHLQNSYYNLPPAKYRNVTRINELNLYSPEEAIAKAVEKLKRKFR